MPVPTIGAFTNFTSQPFTVPFSATPQFDFSISDQLTFGPQTGDVTSSSFVNAAVGQIVQITITADAVGGRLFTWPTNIVGGPFTGSGTLSRSLGANAKDVFLFRYDGTNFVFLSGPAVNTPGTNLFIGYQAGQSNTTGAGGVFIGYQAGQVNTTPVGNTFIGYQAGKANTTGTNQTCVGYQAGLALTTASNCTFIGYQAGGFVTTGNAGTFIGTGAGVTTTSANATTTGLRQTLIGVNSGQNTATQLNDVTVVGWTALVGGNNAIAIGSGVLAGAAGAVAIGKDSANTSASTVVQDEIKLGTSLHTVNVPGDCVLSTVGKGLKVKEGTNATMGVATLVAGAATVPTTKVTASSRIQLTPQSAGGTPGWVRVSARSAGTSFTITSSSGSDTSTVAWLIIEPSP